MTGKTIRKGGGGFTQLSGQPDLACHRPLGWRWYAVECKGGQAELAAKGLGEQDFEVFLPLERYRVRNGHRKNGAPKIEIRQRPLIAPFLFVRLDVHARPWSAVNFTRGVRIILCDAQGWPLPARDEQIEALRKLCDKLAGGDGKPPSRVKAGEDVRIVDGPLGGFNLAVEAVREVDGEFILDGALDIFGRFASVSISEAAVAPL